MAADTTLLVYWARWVGQHALPLFLGTLLLLLAVTCACWWILRRYALTLNSSTVPSRLAMRLRIAVAIAVGIAVIGAGAGVFVGLAAQLGAETALDMADHALTEALRSSVPAAALQVFAAFTHLGDTLTRAGLCVGVGIALATLGRRWLALGWVVAVAGNGLLNLILKQSFGRARPLHADGLVLEQGFSFPSGHSSGAVVLYGMLVYLAFRLLPTRWHLAALVAAVSLAFTVGASRMFLRVHFASDVIAGFASGAAWLALCVVGIELTRCWANQRAAARPNVKEE